MMCAWLRSIRSPTSSRAISPGYSSTFYRRSPRTARWRRSSPQIAGYRETGRRHYRSHGVRAANAVATPEQPAPVRRDRRRRYFRNNIASGAGRGCLCGASAERSIQRTARLDREPAFRHRTSSLPGAGRSEGDDAVRERCCGVEWKPGGGALAESRLICVRQARLASLS